MENLIYINEYAGIIRALYPAGEYELTKDFLTEELDVTDAYGNELGFTHEKDIINFCLKNKNINKFSLFKEFLNERMDFLCNYKNY